MSDLGPKSWIIRRNLGNGAWHVTCTLCGKKFGRSFRPERNADPQQAVSDWITEHLASGPHAAAVETYRAPAPKTTLSNTEVTLSRMLGEEPDDGRTPEQRRRFAARRAAQAAWKQGTP